MPLRLAELTVRVNASPGGALALMHARDKGASADPRVLEVLGTAALREGDRNGAAEDWEAAIAAGSSNVALFRELARMEFEDWFGDFDFDRHLPPDASARLRSRLLRSIEHEPEQTAGYEMLAWVEAFARDRSIANINLVQQRFSGLKRKAYTLVAIAMVRVRMGLKDEALKLVREVSHLEPDAWTAQAAEVIAAKLEGRPIQQLSDTRAGEEVDAGNAGPVRNTMRLPSVPVPGDL